jgi:hypothetical protein
MPFSISALKALWPISVDIAVALLCLRMGKIDVITYKYVINRSYFPCDRQIVLVIHKSRNTGSVIEIIGIN